MKGAPGACKDMLWPGGLGRAEGGEKAEKGAYLRKG